MSRLFLYSMFATDHDWQAVDTLIGKDRKDIRIGMIFNAMDIVPGSENWIHGFVHSMHQLKYQIRTIDLREALQNGVASTQWDDLDMIWVSGGHTYYLRWILAATGADEVIRRFVTSGRVYAGWSAGAIVAGPSLRHFDIMGDAKEDAPELIMEGLHLTDKIIVPHMDHPMFKTRAFEVTARLLADGVKVMPLRDHEVFMEIRS